MPKISVLMPVYKAKKEEIMLFAPVISIIIPCYNQEKYIAECLDSIVVQTFKDFEAIIINDGSTDNSLKVIKPYLKKHSNMRLINQTHRGGVVSARNLAIQKAKGTYIFPLDADDKIRPDCLEKLYQAMEENKGDIIASRVMLFGLKNEEMFLPSPTRFHMIIGNCITNSSLFKKADAVKIGGYDETFKEGLEDYDFWLNLVLHQKCKIYRVPEILFDYRIKAYSESRNTQQKKLMHKELLRKLNKKYPQRTRMRILKKIMSVFYSIKINNGIKTLKILGLRIYK